MNTKPIVYIVSTPDSVEYKDNLLNSLKEKFSPKFDFLDIGPNKEDIAEYNIYTSPYIADKLSVLIRHNSMAIVICGTGGINVPLNRHNNIIAERPSNSKQTKHFRESSNINVLVLSSLYNKNLKYTMAIARAFLTSKFKETSTRLERYKTITSINYGKTFS